MIYTRTAVYTPPVMYSWCVCVCVYVCVLVYDMRENSVHVHV